MIASDLCVLENVRIILVGRRALFCAIEGRSAWIPRSLTQSGSEIAAGEGQRLIIPQWLAEQLELPASPLTAKPVLLVDDDDEARELMARTLEGVGYRVESAADGLRALQLLRQGLDPCLILLDLRMPIMDAAGFRAEQTKDARLAELPVVLISGGPDVDVEAAALGIAHFCRKPVRPSALLALVERHRTRN